MVSKSEFCDQIGNAYQHLYDLVRLRNHPLAQLLVTDPAVDQKERGWQVHRRLLAAIEELYPGTEAPPYSKEWRRHRLMVLRYVEAMDAQAVADQLAISRRQYYREHASAIEAVAGLLWERSDNTAFELTHQPAISNDTNAMQRELARISQTDAFASLPEVLQGVVAVLNRVLEQAGISVEITLPEEMPVVSIGHNLLRQVLLGATGYLSENVAQSRISITAQPTDTTMRLVLEADTYDISTGDEFESRLVNLQEMLQMANASIALLYEREAPTGFVLELPLEYQWIALVVDDNEDTLTLFKRYLTPNRYRVITVPSADLVLNLAREIRPDVIILDLMMPEHDGWDLLQLLSNQPDTAHLPIVICSVLKQKELALSLGASAYLPKPFTEQALLAVLDSLQDMD
ncbi:MAG: response regulator [Anaerolineae bacterium]|nr:response regulator [Anaerolineae bacterium]